MHQASSEDHKLKTQGGLRYAFEELPGFFVSFVYLHQDESSFTHSVGEEVDFCGGSHLGGGYILTAAHCIAFLFNREGAQVKDWLGVDVIIEEAQGERSRHRVPLSKIQSMVYHADYRASGDHYDIALLKVDGRIPFAAEVILADDEIYSLENLEGSLWVYGAGKARDRDSKTKYYRGGLAYVSERLGEEDFMKDVIRTLSAELKEGNVEDRLVRDVLFRVKGYTKAVLDYFTLEKQGHAFTHTQRQEIIEKMLTKFSLNYDEALWLYRTLKKTPKASEELKLFAEAFLQSFSYRKHMSALSASHHLTEEITSSHGNVLAQDGPQEDLHSVMYFSSLKKSKRSMIALCRGDSGGPVLKKNSAGAFVLVGINLFAEAYATLRSMVHFRESSDLLGCGGEEASGGAINVWAHRKWIQAAQESIAGGHHRVPGYLVK